MEQPELVAYAANRIWSFSVREQESQVAECEIILDGFGCEENA